MSAPRLQQPMRLAIRKKPSCSLPMTRYYATTVESDTASTRTERPGKGGAWEVDVYGFGRKKGDPSPKWKMPPTRDVSDLKFFPQPTKKKPEPRKAFAVYSPPPRSRLAIPPKNPLPQLARNEMDRHDPTGARKAMFRRDARDSVKPGDVLRVVSTKGEPFAGVLINLRRRGAETAICLRGKMMGTGVEMWYKVFSTKIGRIDVIWRRPKRARRAKLMYMRKPKHDMGSVDHLVDAWFRSRITVGRAKNKGPEKKKVKVMKRSKVRAKEAARAAGVKRKEEADERRKIKQEEKDKRAEAREAKMKEKAAAKREKAPEETTPEKTEA